MENESEIEIDTETLNTEEDTDVDELSLEQLIERMEEAWLNEKFAPEILPHQNEIVEILLGQISQMEENLKTLESTNIKKGIHQMEIDRLKFLVTTYLRMRLEKIETFSTIILKEERQRSEKNEEMYLNPNELELAEEYEKNLKNHFDAIMQFCPNALDPDQLIVKPNIHSMVFLKSKKNIEGITIDDGNGENDDLIDLKKDSQILISYNSVSHLVKEGDIHLI